MKANFTEEELTLLKSIINKLTEEEKMVKHDYSNVEVGDYMLKDGTTVSPIGMTGEQKSQAIGIVAYLYEEHKNIFLKNGVKATLKTKGIEKPHGIIIALKDAEEGEYYESKVSCVAKGYRSLNEQVFYGVDGLEMTDSRPNIEDFPAFKAAKEYEQEVPAPENTTGWYLPSVGEWFCMLNHYDKFSKFITQNERYWTSSIHSADSAYSVYFNSSGDIIYYDSYAPETLFIRPVLAF